MKRLNYYQVHKNKQPKKLKFETIKKKRVSFIIKIDTSSVEKAIKKASKSILSLGKALNKLEIKNL